MPEYYEIRHTVGFEETNVVGNVYFAHYAKWQGVIRERFLKEHAPSVIGEIKDGLKLFTVKLECTFTSEVTAFDELAIRMRLIKLMQTQLVMGFEYAQLIDDGEIAVATGSQHIAFMRGDGPHATPVAVPTDLRLALDAYSGEMSYG